MIKDKPIVLITMGDPAGIGPEIIMKTLREERIYRFCRPVVAGDPAALKRAAAVLDMILPFTVLETPEDVPEGKPCLILAETGRTPPRWGVVSATGGEAAMASIKKAVELALQYRLPVATAPINKESLRAAGINAIGHTEIFGELCGVADPLTMFETEGLRIFFLTRHVSLRRACDLVTRDKLLEYIPLCLENLRRLGMPEPTLAVAGLNPHSGEHGLFGDEEVNIIEPAVNEAKARGYKVVGPVGADSVFHLAKTGRYDAVLSLYHDQGHIAAKTLDFERTISLTLGLPVLRTSVDHGTAFDIAGNGTASPVSMMEAVRLAAHYGSLV
jgi:4-hydroxythreonine-4-phosphate dehydrogenase